MRWLLLTVLWLMGAQALWAQDAAHLVADRIEISPDGALRASGSVTVWHGGVQITARTITYESREGRLSLSGPHPAARRQRNSYIGRSSRSVLRSLRGDHHQRPDHPKPASANCRGADFPRECDL